MDSTSTSCDALSFRMDGHASRKVSYMNQLETRVKSIEILKKKIVCKGKEKTDKKRKRSNRFSGYRDDSVSRGFTHHETGNIIYFFFLPSLP